jgi:1-acyl-sn-glycerol-3-phosphate acyltransferase
MIYYWQNIGCGLACFYGKLFFKLRYHGLENIRGLKGGNVMFVANHMGKFDPFLVGCGLGRKYRRSIKGLMFPTAIEHANDSWYGGPIRLVGAYPIQRDKNEDLENKLKESLDYLLNGRALVIFPQGKRSNSCEPQEARPGVAWLAEQSNALIIPVQIFNSYKIGLMDLFVRRDVNVIYGAPFKYADIAQPKSDYKEAAKRIMARVCGLTV